ncbi:MAG: acyl-ACP--UDP-N-acetylglucosamine O-acyltransferase [Saprospiraceae bacterium]
MNQGNSLRVIHPNAKIGANVYIGPFTYIEEDVEIGDNCWIGNNVTILNGARIGHSCKIFPGAVVSAIPQDLKYKGENTLMVIGNNVTIRECCTLNRGTAEAGKTEVGDNCLLMAYVHVAHDCIIGQNCILANNAALAGHIEIEDFARIGGMVAVHQFVRIGAYTMIGGGSLVRKDVPPFVLAAREPLSYAGVNRVGLRRAHFQQEEIHQIEDVYRILFQRGHQVRKALEIIRNELPDTEHRRKIIAFAEKAERGLMRGYRS